VTHLAKKKKEKDTQGERRRSLALWLLCFFWSLARAQPFFLLVKYLSVIYDKKGICEGQGKSGWRCRVRHPGFLLSANRNRIVTGQKQSPFVCKMTFPAGARQHDDIGACVQHTDN
jgi:hypothetical protein